MKYVKMWAENGYCGCRAEDYLEYSDDSHEAEIDAAAEEMMFENAEEYDYVARGWDEEWEDAEAEESYYEGCSFGWKYITEEEYRENT